MYRPKYIRPSSGPGARLCKREAALCLASRRRSSLKGDARVAVSPLFRKIELSLAMESPCTSLRVGQPSDLLLWYLSLERLGSCMRPGADLCLFV